MGVKRLWGYREWQYSALSLATFSDTLEMRPELLDGDMQSVVGFSVIPTSENNCVKTNKDDILSAVMHIFGRDSTFWQYKVCADIRSGSLFWLLKTIL